MPVKDQAAYMREYRAKRKACFAGGGQIEDVISVAAARILALEAEVAQLKRLLATRAERQPGTFPLTREELGLGTSAILPHQRDPIRDPMREFRPAPKSGKGK